MSERYIRWTKGALRRLDEICAHIPKDNSDAAVQPFARIVLAVDILANFPAGGCAGRINGTRELVLADVPYNIPYRVEHDVEILTICMLISCGLQSFRFLP